MHTEKPRLIAIVGPTATGKTELAIKLAQNIQAEIISADSMQIYKNLDILTAKPTKEEMQNIPHHMLSIIDLDQKFSVARYKKMADEIIHSIIKRNKIPIIVGGTGLYVNAVLDNINFLENSRESTIRSKLCNEMQNLGVEALMKELRSVDPNTAERLHLNDKKRIIRALEIYRSTGLTLSEQNLKSRSQGAIYNPTIIGLDYSDREKLYNKINKRVDTMMEKGLLQEAVNVFNRQKNGEISITAAAAIGYKELISYLKGEIDLKEAIDKIKQNTRRYSKRQRTWFKRDERVNWIYVDNFRNIDEICHNVYSYGLKR